MNELELRNELARTRTEMANQRTLLAHINTSLAFIGLAIVLYKFMEREFSLIAVPVILTLALLTFLHGVFRHRAVSASITEQEHPKEGQTVAAHANT